MSHARKNTLAAEGLITLPEVAAILPKNNGKPLSLRSIARWIRTGKAGTILDAIRLADKWVTSKPALKGFLADVDRRTRVLEKQVEAA